MTDETFTYVMIQRDLYIFRYVLCFWKKTLLLLVSLRSIPLNPNSHSVPVHNEFKQYPHFSQVHNTGDIHCSRFGIWFQAMVCSIICEFGHYAIHKIRSYVLANATFETATFETVGSFLPEVLES